MKSLLLLLLLFVSIITNAQHPKDGIYHYKIAFAEWQGKSFGTTCTVIIKGNKIKILSNGNGKLTAKKGHIIAQGIIMKHAKSGKWIIGHNARDKEAEDIGGCSDGPIVIDFKLKILWLC